MSNFDLTTDDIKKNVVTGGYDAVEVIQDYLDTDSFNQDLLIRHIPNAWDAVVWDSNSFKRDRSDAQWVIVLKDLTPSEFEEKFPDHAEDGVSNGRFTNAYSYKPETITTGKLYRKKKVNKTLLLMSNGAVYEEKDGQIVNSQGLDIRDDLAAQGITETDRRTSKSFEVTQRIFGGSKWLTEEEETVFTDYLPVIPFYGNWKVSESKCIWYGCVLKLMDEQRVLNYAGSKEVEEVALSPRAKTWMTPEQAAGHEGKLATQNVNSDPVQLYNHVADQPNPYQIGGAPVNPQLSLVRQQLDQDISKSAGLFASNMGHNPGLQSGEAIKEQVARGNNGILKWFNAIEVGMAQLGKVLVKAIPKVYDARRQVRIIGEDGSSEIVTLNDVIIDAQTQQLTSINDLSKGQYDVTCEVGEPFKNQQKETAQAFIEIAQVDPSIAQMGKDIWLNNLEVPGFKELAERIRLQQVQQGIIPDDQLTDEELAMVQQMRQQPQEPSPEMVLAQAEMKKADNEGVEHQLKAQSLQLEQQKIQLKLAELQDNSQARREKTESETALNVAKVQQENRKIDLSEIELQLKSQSEQTKLVMEQNQAMVQGMNTMADTLNKLRESMGADAIVNPNAAQAYNEVAEDIKDGAD